MNPLHAQKDYQLYFNEDKVSNSQYITISLGNLNLPSGSIVACDPITTLGRSLAFNKLVPKGTYPVTAAVYVDESSSGTIALVKIEFLNKPISYWEMALTEYDDVSLMTNPNDYFGFPVNANLACFCDEITQDSFENNTAINPEDNSEEENFYEQLDQLLYENPSTQNEDYHWMNYTIPGTEQQNLILFTSGKGEGNYPCYWGMTAENEVAALVVDFFVVQ